MTVNTKETKVLKLDQISPNTWNPHGMTSEEFMALRESVREKGAWRPVVVVELDKDDEYTKYPEAKYRIVDGEHLHRALTAEHIENGGTDEVVVLVYGKNSEVPLDVQMEIGQTINHGMRGTLEDTKKTGLIVDVLARTRSITEIARRTGQSESYLTAARTVAVAPSRTPAVQVTRQNSERKGQTVPLVFETNEDLARYQTAIKHWEAKADPDGELTPGRRRIAAVLMAVENFQTASPEVLV